MKDILSSGVIFLKIKITTEESISLIFTYNTYKSPEFILEVIDVLRDLLVELTQNSQASLSSEDFSRYM